MSPTDAGLSDAIGCQKAQCSIAWLISRPSVTISLPSTIVFLPDGGSANIAMSLEGVVARLSGSRGLGEDAT